MNQNFRSTQAIQIMWHKYLRKISERFTETFHSMQLIERWRCGKFIDRRELYRMKSFSRYFRCFVWDTTQVFSHWKIKIKIVWLTFVTGKPSKRSRLLYVCASAWQAVRILFSFRQSLATSWARSMLLWAERPATDIFKRRKTNRIRKMFFFYGNICKPLIDRVDRWVPPCLELEVSWSVLRLLCVVPRLVRSYCVVSTAKQANRI